MEVRGFSVIVGNFSRSWPNMFRNGFLRRRDSSWQSLGLSCWFSGRFEGVLVSLVFGIRNLQFFWKNELGWPIPLARALGRDPEQDFAFRHFWKISKSLFQIFLWRKTVGWRRQHCNIWSWSAPLLSALSNIIPWGPPLPLIWKFIGSNAPLVFDCYPCHWMLL